MSLTKLTKQQEADFAKWWNTDKDVLAWKEGMSKDQVRQMVKEGWPEAEARKKIKPISYDYPKEMIKSGNFYDYRKAWLAGDKPMLNKHDGKYHWGSSGKGENHPTAHKQRFYEAYGFNPDDQNMTDKQINNALLKKDFIELLYP